MRVTSHHLRYIMSLTSAQNCLRADNLYQFKIRCIRILDPQVHDRFLFKIRYCYQSDHLYPPILKPMIGNTFSCKPEKNFPSWKFLSHPCYLTQVILPRVYFRTLYSIFTRKFTINAHLGRQLDLKLCITLKH